MQHNHHTWICEILPVGVTKLKVVGKVGRILAFLVFGFFIQG